MNKLTSIFLAVVFTLGVTATSVEAKTTKVFKNCTELRKVFPKGVAKSTAAAGTTGAAVNSKVYSENKKSDGDKDGIACEK